MEGQTIVTRLFEQAWEICRHLFNSQLLMTTLSRPEYMIASFIVLNLVVFAETGLLVGFFLPGDSLLVTAGLLAATTGVFNVFGLGLLLTAASILGNTVGYGIGRAAGPRLFTREDSLLFNKKHLIRAHEFYAQNLASSRRLGMWPRSRRCCPSARPICGA